MSLPSTATDELLAAHPPHSSSTRVRFRIRLFYTSGGTRVAQQRLQARRDFVDGAVALDRALNLPPAGAPVGGRARRTAECTPTDSRPRAAARRRGRGRTPTAAASRTARRACRPSPPRENAGTARTRSRPRTPRRRRPSLRARASSCCTSAATSPVAGAGVHSTLCGALWQPSQQPTARRVQRISLSLASRGRAAGAAERAPVPGSPSGRRCAAAGARRWGRRCCRRSSACCSALASACSC